MSQRHLKLKIQDYLKDKIEQFTINLINTMDEKESILIKGKIQALQAMELEISKIEFNSPDDLDVDDF